MPRPLPPCSHVHLMRGTCFSHATSCAFAHSGRSHAASAQARKGASTIIAASLLPDIASLRVADLKGPAPRRVAASLALMKPKIGPAVPLHLAPYASDARSPCDTTALTFTRFFLSAAILTQRCRAVASLACLVAFLLGAPPPT